MALNSVHIGIASEADLREVIASARGASGLPEWPDWAWQTFLQSGAVGEGRHDVLLVARAAGDTLVGWLAASGFEETVELESVMVLPTRRQRGIGELMMKFWFGWAQTRGAQVAVLEVRPSNTAAIHLYTKLGFQAQGRRRAYYLEPPEDALSMRSSLSRAAV